MDKESAFLLQQIDSNCNECKFMIRNLEKHKRSLELHHKWQKDEFDMIKNKILKKAAMWRGKGENDKASVLEKEAGKMKFLFNKLEASINYGHCTRFNKDVSFIPNHYQIETQKCFIHRRNEQFEELLKDYSQWYKINSEPDLGGEKP